MISSCTKLIYREVIKILCKVTSLEDAAGSGHQAEGVKSMNGSRNLSHAPAREILVVIGSGTIDSHVHLSDDGNSFRCRSAIGDPHR